MRTLGEILESALNNERPSADECYFAMLAFYALGGFSSRALRRLGKDGGAVGKMEADEDFWRWKRAYAVPPDDWLGPNHTPGTPEQARVRKMALAVLRKVEEAGQ